MKTSFRAQSVLKKRLSSLLAIAIAAIALVLSGCPSDSGDSGTGGDNPQKPKEGTVVTDIKVYFLNGWESDIADLTGLAETVIGGKQKSGVSPGYLNAVIDEKEAQVYAQAVATRNSVIEARAQYERDMEAFLAGDMSGAQPVEPEAVPPEPVAPSPTLPYFPGTAFYNGLTKFDPEHPEIEIGLPIIDTVGENPVLEGYGLLGWELWHDYEAGEGVDKNNGAVPLTLTTVLEAKETSGTALSGTYYAVATWQEINAPSRPTGTPADAPAPIPYKITFEKNDGSGEAKVGFAFPTEVWFIATDQEATGLDYEDDPNLGKITKNSSLGTEFAKYGAYKLASDVGDDFISAVPSDYTRIYWDQDGWLDLEEQSKVLKDGHTPTADKKLALDANTTYKADSFYYQNWKPKMWAINFKLGRESGSSDAKYIVGSLINTTETKEFEAPKLAAGGFAAAGCTAATVPNATGTGYADDEAGAGTVTDNNRYTFATWNTAKDYSGQPIGLNTPITAGTKLDGELIVIDDSKPAYDTLYAEWNIAGQVSFNFSGVNVKEFKVPATAEYKIELWGAAGAVGSWSGYEVYNGKGGYISGTVNLTKDDVYYIYLGGKPRDSGNRYRWANGDGGFNGGRMGGEGHSWGSAGGKSGGATDIRTIKASSEAAAATDQASLASRIMVAGGGGGGSDSGVWLGTESKDAEAYGGNGGVGIARGGNGRGLNTAYYDVGYLANSGGPLASGNTVLNNYKVKGEGQEGRTDWPSNSGNGNFRKGAGAGGGGYYGGAAAIDDPYAHVIGGGGGSSWANKSGVDGYVSSFNVTKAGGGTTARNLEVTNVYAYKNGADEDGTGKGTWTGAGKVKITYTPPTVTP